jgi:hypothetical protein
MTLGYRLWTLNKKKVEFQITNQIIFVKYNQVFRKRTKLRKKKKQKNNKISSKILTKLNKKEIKRIAVHQDSIYKKV